MFVQKALQLAQQNNEKYYEAISLIWMGRILLDSNSSQIAKVEDCIFKGIKICEALRMKPFYFIGFLFIGELYTLSHQQEKAIDNFNKAEVGFREMGMDNWLAMTYAAYADLSKREGDLSKSKKHLQSAISIFKELSATGWVDKYEKTLAEL